MAGGGAPSTFSTIGYGRFYSFLRKDASQIQTFPVLSPALLGSVFPPATSGLPQFPTRTPEGGCCPPGPLRKALTLRALSSIQSRADTAAQASVPSPPCQVTVAEAYGPPAPADNAAKGVIAHVHTLRHRHTDTRTQRHTHTLANVDIQAHLAKRSIARRPASSGIPSGPAPISPRRNVQAHRGWGLPPSPEPMSTLPSAPGGCQD